MPVGPENKCEKKKHFFRVAEVVDIWMVFFLFYPKTGRGIIVSYRKGA